jgi:Cu/Ag efflux pump CusA
MGRAVIGGLMFATVATLFFVPAVFNFVYLHLHRRRDARNALVPATAH